MKSHIKRIVIVLVIASVLGGCRPEAIHDRKHQAVEENVILKIYLVRHSQAYKNILYPPGTPEEKLDSLTPKGQLQADSIGNFLKGKGIVAVITSPAGRTRETADAIGTTLGLGKHYLEDSAFTSLKNGKRPDGSPASWSWREKQWERGLDPRPEGGESLADGSARVLAAINRLAKKYRGKSVAIVTHGDICSVLIGQVENTPIQERYKLHDVATGSVSEIIKTESGLYSASQGVTPSAY